MLLLGSPKDQIAHSANESLILDETFRVLKWCKIFSIHRRGWEHLEIRFCDVTQLPQSPMPLRSCSGCAPV